MSKFLSLGRRTKLKDLEQQYLGTITPESRTPRSTSPLPSRPHSRSSQAKSVGCTSCWQVVLNEMAASLEQDVFLMVTKFFLSAIHQVLEEPTKLLNRKFAAKSERITNACSKDAVKQFLTIANIEYLHGVFEIDAQLSEEDLQVLKQAEDALIEARKRTGKLDAWSVFLPDVALADRIGAGAFGEVFIGKLKGTNVAVKTLKGKISKNKKKAFFREADIMKSLKHINVLGLTGVVLKKPYMIVMEKMEGNLQDYLRTENGSLKDLLDLARGVAAGLDYLHNEIKLIHCDLAARNVLMTKHNVVKLADFGQSRPIGSPECDISKENFPIPIRWTPAELWDTRYITPTMDIWAFGVTFYEIMTGGLVPYNNFTSQQVKREVRKGYRLPAPPECPAEFYDIMQRTWAVNPDERPDISGVLALLIQVTVSLADKLSKKRSLSMQSRSRAASSENGDNQMELSNPNTRRDAFSMPLRTRQQHQSEDIGPFSFFMSKLRGKSSPTDAGSPATGDGDSMRRARRTSLEPPDGDAYQSRMSFSRRAVVKRKSPHGSNVNLLESSLEAKSWYHGRRKTKFIKEESEPLLRNDGDFMVHETCVPGEFILSVLWKIPLHIKLLKDSRGVIEFDELKFSSLTELIDHFVTTKAPLTFANKKIVLKHSVAREEDTALDTIDEIEERIDHDIFLAYQVETEGNAVRLLYSKLNEMPTSTSRDIVCFLDQYDLTQTVGVDPWLNGLKSALLSAKVFVVLISEKALKLNSSADCDPAFLRQLAVAVEKHKAGEMLILPVYLGQRINIPHPTKANKHFEVYDSFDKPDLASFHDAPIDESNMTSLEVFEYVFANADASFEFNPYEDDYHILSNSIVEKLQDLQPDLLASPPDESFSEQGKRLSVTRITISHSDSTDRGGHHDNGSNGNSDGDATGSEEVREIKALFGKERRVSRERALSGGVVPMYLTPQESHRRRKEVREQLFSSIRRKTMRKTKPRSDSINSQGSEGGEGSEEAREAMRQEIKSKLLKLNALQSDDEDEDEDDA